MAGFISRLKNWLGYENLASADVNAEFNNLISKMGSDTISGANSTLASAPTVAAMRTTENPGAVGSEVLAKTIQDDIQQLRFQLNAIIGGAQWYSAPDQSIHSLSGLVNGISFVPQNRILSGRNVGGQPMFLVANGAAASVSLKATAVN